MSKRKIICLLMCAVFIIPVIGCEKNDKTNSRTSGSSNSVEDILVQRMNDQSAAEDTTPSPEPTDIPSGRPGDGLSGGEAGIDVDLTILSGTMVYSEVYNMMFYPENYVGKKVKMSGMYAVSHNDETDRYYHGCIVKDATACCAQGIEFEPAGNFVYPDEYPQEGAAICVVGTFETYKEDENTYCILKDAQVRTDSAFYISGITDGIFARIDGKSFSKDCTIPREDLRYLHVLHKDLNGNDHEGELIVNRHIAGDVLDIMKQLYEAGYPIEKMRLVDEYGADDEMSMEDNNSSAFNFRFITHTKKVSKHGMGLAVDINPLYNPYIKNTDTGKIVEPVTAEAYLDRDADFPYKIDKNDLCYKLFTEKGFEWGGSWKSAKDYQHFEIPDNIMAGWYP